MILVLFFCTLVCFLDFLQWSYYFHNLKSELEKEKLKHLILVKFVILKNTAICDLKTKKHLGVSPSLYNKKLICKLFPLLGVRLEAMLAGQLPATLHLLPTPSQSQSAPRPQLGQPGQTLPVHEFVHQVSS